jgi:hypothetical protein
MLVSGHYDHSSAGYNKKGKILMHWYSMYLISLRYAWAAILDGFCYATDKRLGHIHHMYDVTVWCLSLKDGRLQAWLDHGDKRYASNRRLRTGNKVA